MGLQITKGRKKGTFHVWSSITESYVLKSVTRDRIMELFLDRARSEINRRIDLIEAGIGIKER